MSAIEPEPSEDLTPEQSRQQAIAILARSHALRAMVAQISAVGEPCFFRLRCSV